MGTASGYAIKDANGNIDVRTVSPTKLGAMVNWLTPTLGFIISAKATDELITQAFDDLKAFHGVACIRVDVGENHE